MAANFAAEGLKNLMSLGVGSGSGSSGVGMGTYQFASMIQQAPERHNQKVKEEEQAVREMVAPVPAARTAGAQYGMSR